MYYKIQRPSSARFEHYGKGCFYSSFSTDYRCLSCLNCLQNSQRKYHTFYGQYHLVSEILKIADLKIVARICMIS